MFTAATFHFHAESKMLGFAYEVSLDFQIFMGGLSLCLAILQDTSSEDTREKQWTSLLRVTRLAKSTQTRTPCVSANNNNLRTV